MSRGYGRMRWVLKHGRYYLEDDKFGYAYVDRRSRSDWHWCGPNNLGSAPLLRIAKSRAEADVRGTRRLRVR